MNQTSFSQKSAATELFNNIGEASENCGIGVIHKTLFVPYVSTIACDGDDSPFSYWVHWVHREPIGKRSGGEKSGAEASNEWTNKTIKARDTLEHQSTVWPVPYACARPYHQSDVSLALRCFSKEWSAHYARGFTLKLYHLENKTKVNTLWKKGSDKPSQVKLRSAIHGSPVTDLICRYYNSSTNEGNAHFTDRSQYISLY